jgi:hypothetical protein
LVFMLILAFLIKGFNLAYIQQFYFYFGITNF